MTTLTTSTTVFGLTLDPERGANMAAVFSSLSTMPKPYTLVTSFTEPLDGLTQRVVYGGDKGGWERIRAARLICEPLVQSLKPEAWPSSAADAIEIMEDKPSVFSGWRLRNLLWMCATKSFIYWVDEEVLRAPDLAVFLTASRVLGYTSIGIMPSDLRQMLESTQLTLTNVIVGEADTRTLSTVLESLKDGDV